jgi:ABC-type Fe3+/spermidine/putrescine transport system ATPase subunit
MIGIRGVSKSFGKTKVLEKVDLEIREGEFFCLLGPSGCGKTTLLRAVAGLETPDGGSLFIGGKDVTSSPPHLRGCAMVFQSYALWPHLTVAENITYGLEVRKERPETVKRVLAESLRSFRLEGLEDRQPHQLSGGQQQRVALARAMAMKPAALLMDEPLSNLDAALRKTLRRELLDFHRKAGNTVVYVTHDQEEALALGDRIALMMQGKVIEMGEPARLYERPERLETALFLGDMNVFRWGRREEVRIGFGTWYTALPDGNPEADTLCIRPEKVRLHDPEVGGAPDFDLDGTVRFKEFLGTHALVSLDTPAGPLLARVTPEEAHRWTPGRKALVGLPQADRLWYRGSEA